ncbi:MAG TPA: hypothetical protein VI612_03820 [Candidatus Nanoarchaeia archaeon]|nr:hypothetical protein [Candidatus Nanoarchaeia archaeon]
MEEKQAMLGILLIMVVSVASFFVFSSGSSGAAVSATPYLTCCCDILAKSGYAKQAEQALFRSQIQTFEDSCVIACQKNYAGYQAVFAEEGRC